MRVLVCGAGGFIGSHLVKRLKAEGHWVRGADLKQPQWSMSPADEFFFMDLRRPESCEQAVAGIDHVYQFAAQMGGMGYVSTEEYIIMHDSSLINIHMLNAAVHAGVARYFFSSSVCVYRDMEMEEPVMTEEQAHFAEPDNGYGKEKLYAEDMALACARRYPGMQVRIARFQNTYGPEGTWQGGREKAPAAICRKVAMNEGYEGAGYSISAENRYSTELEIWGDGSAVRSYTYIDDLIDGILCLMESPLAGPVNIGSSEFVTVDQLVDCVLAVADKTLPRKYVEGPVGVQYRNFSKVKIRGLGWRAKTTLRQGIAQTYPWVEKQVYEQLAR